MNVYLGSDNIGDDSLSILNDRNSANTYQLAVLNYYAGYLNVPDIKDTAAKLEVFDSSSSSPIRVYTVPQTGEGDLWFVFTLEFGTLVDQGCLSIFEQSGDTPPDDCFDLNLTQIR